MVKIFFISAIIVFYSWFLYVWFIPYVRFYILKEAKVGVKFVSRRKKTTIPSIIEISRIDKRSIYIKYVEINGEKFDVSNEYEWDIWGFFTLYEKVKK